MPPKRRRSRGEGAVFRRASDGFWVGTLDLGVVDGHRRRKTVYSQSEREVLQKLSTRPDLTQDSSERVDVAARVQVDPERAR